ncbi:MAG: glycerol-3-phosphate acyltransferase [Clostridia bacterium]|nr:glycerol-3-phosphate acyltransferase [Clostridia bacterium]
MLEDWNAWAIALIAVLGYLFGNLQTAMLISKLYFHDDIRRYGSGNAGSTNMLRVYGKLFGLATLLGDALKCVLAVLAGRWLGQLLGLHIDPYTARQLGGYIAGLAVLIGHCFPVFFGFKGGKGAASALAYIWLLCPLAALFTTVCCLIVLVLTRKISLVSIMGAVLFPMFTGILLLSPAYAAQHPYLIYFTVAGSALVLLRHIPNIRRLISGEEKNIAEPKKKN